MESLQLRLWCIILSATLLLPEYFDEILLQLVLSLMSK